MTHDSSEDKELLNQTLRLVPNKKVSKPPKPAKLVDEPLMFLSQAEKNQLFPGLNEEYGRSKKFFYTYSREYHLTALTGQEFRYLWLAEMGFNLEDIGSYLNTRPKVIVTMIQRAKVKVSFHQPTQEFFKKFCRAAQQIGLVQKNDT